jgi:hypothetical protein
MLLFNLLNSGLVPICFFGTTCRSSERRSPTRDALVTIFQIRGYFYDGGWEAGEPGGYVSTRSAMKAQLVSPAMIAGTDTSGSPYFATSIRVSGAGIFPGESGSSDGYCELSSTTAISSAVSPYSSYTSASICRSVRSIFFWKISRAGSSIAKAS